MSDFERVDGNSVKSTLSTGDEMEKCYGCSARTVEYTGYCDLAQYEKGAYDAYYYYENLVRKTDFADSEQVRKWEREMLQAWVEMLSRGDWEQYQKVQTIAGKKWIQNTYGNSLDSIGITSAKLDNIEYQGQHAYQITVKYQGCNDRDIWPFCEEDDETFEEQII